MQKESRKKILATVSSCVAMYENTWPALSFGAETLHTIRVHVATRPRTSQPRNRGSICDTDKNFISPIFPDNSTVHPTSCSTDTGVSFLWDKAVGS